MSDKDSLGDRMKGYESVPRARLVPRMPVLLRLDGKAFHTLTRNMDKPVDEKFQLAMWETARHLCEEIQGCQVAYVQSDEITLLLVDYQTINTQGWFEYEVQKMCSVAAGMASVQFSEWLNTAGIFDCRAWNLPREEVVNCFIWRQQDATRNAIQMLGQSKFSHKQLHGKSCPVIQEMLFQEHGINFNDCPVPQKRGVCVVKETYTITPSAESVKHLPHMRTSELVAQRTRWIIDEAIPIFTQDRNYIQKHVDVAERE